MITRQIHICFSPSKWCPFMSACKRSPFCRKRQQTMEGIKQASQQFWEARTLRRSFLRWQRDFDSKTSGRFLAAPLPPVLVPAPRSKSYSETAFYDSPIERASERRQSSCTMQDLHCIWATSTNARHCDSIGICRRERPQNRHRPAWKSTKSDVHRADDVRSRENEIAGNGTHTERETCGQD